MKTKVFFGHFSNRLLIIALSVLNFGIKLCVLIHVH